MNKLDTFIANFEQLAFFCKENKEKYEDAIRSVKKTLNDERLVEDLDDFMFDKETGDIMIYWLRDVLRRDLENDEEFYSDTLEICVRFSKDSSTLTVYDSEKDDITFAEVYGIEEADYERLRRRILS